MATAKDILTAAEVTKRIERLQGFRTDFVGATIVRSKNAKFDRSTGQLPRRHSIAARYDIRNNMKTEFPIVRIGRYFISISNLQVARAWTDADFKARLLDDGITAAAELGAFTGGFPARGGTSGAYRPDPRLVRVHTKLHHVYVTRPRDPTCIQSEPGVSKAHDAHHFCWLLRLTA